MARHWTRASTDTIGFLNPDFDGFTGATTWAALVKKATDGQIQAIISIHNATPAVRMGLRFNVSDQLEIFTSSGSGASTTTVTVSDGWCFVAGTRASGTTTPRLHIYKYGTNTWTHENAGGSFANGLSAATATIRLGTATTSGNAYDGDMEVAAVWQRELSDAEIENLAYTLQPLYAAAPNWLVKLDQSATGQTIVNHVRSNGNQSAISGTSIATSNPPIFNYGAGIMRSGANAAPPPTSVEDVGDITVEVELGVSMLLTPIRMGGVTVEVETGGVTMQRPEVTDVGGITVEVETGTSEVGRNPPRGRGPDPLPALGVFSSGVFVDWADNGDWTGDYDNLTAACTAVAFDIDIGKDSESGNTTDQPVKSSRLTVRVTNQEGVFSPRNSDSPLFGQLVPERRICVLVSDGVDSHTIFTGWIERISPSAQVGDITRATITAYGGLHQVGRRSILPQLITESYGESLVAQVLELANWPDYQTTISGGGGSIAGQFQPGPPIAIREVFRIFGLMDPLATFYDGYDWSISYEGAGHRFNEERSTEIQVTFSDDLEVLTGVYARIEQTEAAENTTSNIQFIALNGEIPTWMSFDDEGSPVVWGKSLNWPMTVFVHQGWGLVGVANTFNLFNGTSPPTILTIDIPVDREENLSLCLPLRISDRVGITANTKARLGLEADTFYVEGIRYSLTRGDILRMQLTVSSSYDGLKFHGGVTQDEESTQTDDVDLPEPTAEEDVSCLFPCDPVIPPDGAIPDVPAAPPAPGGGGGMGGSELEFEADRVYQLRTTFSLTAPNDTWPIPYDADGNFSGVRMDGTSTGTPTYVGDQKEPDAPFTNQYAQRVHIARFTLTDLDEDFTAAELELHQNASTAGSDWYLDDKDIHVYYFPDCPIPPNVGGGSGSYTDLELGAWVDWDSLDLAGTVTPLPTETGGLIQVTLADITMHAEPDGTLILAIVLDPSSAPSMASSTSINQVSLRGGSPRPTITFTV